MAQSSGQYLERTSRLDMVRLEVLEVALLYGDCCGLCDVWAECGAVHFWVSDIELGWVEVGFSITLYLSGRSSAVQVQWRLAILYFGTLENSTRKTTAATASLQRHN